VRLESFFYSLIPIQRVKVLKAIAEHNIDKKCQVSLSPVYWPFFRQTRVGQCQNISILGFLSELRMMEVVVTTGAIRCAKLQSNRHHQQTNTFLQVVCPSCCPTNSVKALKGKEIPGNLSVIA